MISSRLRRLWLIILLPLLALAAHAQQCVVTGNVSDAETKEPLISVNISYELNGNRLACITDSNGAFSITLPTGTNTTLLVSYIGYRKTTKLIATGKKKQLAVNILLKPESSELNEVVVKRRIPLVTQRGDTTIYKASDFKVNSDATAYELISQRLPGVGIRDGKLEAHGEQVQSVEIDGREYFKDDVNMALKNLPANIINEIQVYDQLSDYSKLTGFDDGNKKKAINITTKQGTDKSMFGKLTGGGGINSVYNGYGVFNLFRNDLRLTLFAQGNNINEQNFSTIDMLGGGGASGGGAPSRSPYNKGKNEESFHPSSGDNTEQNMTDANDHGITTSYAAGTNYADEWCGGKMKFTGHYLFNDTKNETEYSVKDTYIDPSAGSRQQMTNINTDNLNHRFKSKYEYNIGKRDYLMLRPAITYQRKHERSDISDWQQQPGEEATEMKQYTNSKQYAASTAVEAMYMHKFDTVGRALVADVRLSYAHHHEDQDMSIRQADDNTLQTSLARMTQKTGAYVLSYIHPLGVHSRLRIDGGWSRTSGEINRETNSMTGNQAAFSTNPLLSGYTESVFGGPLANLVYLLNYNKLNVVLGSEFHSYEMKNTNATLQIRRRYNTFLPFAVMKYKLGSAQLLLQYKTSHNYPGLTQLHEVIDNANASMIVKGNLALEPAYQHNITTRVVWPMLSNGGIFVFFTNIEQANNYIGAVRSLQKDATGRSQEVMSYRNCDGFFSVNSLLAYGFPWRFISSNVNLSTTMKYSEIPGYWNDTKQFTDLWNWSGSMTIGSNISEKVDFVIDVNSRYTASKNQLFGDINTSYWSLSYGGQLNWHFVPSWKLVLECGRTNYFGSGTSQYNAVISNAALAYKFLKGKKGELRLSVNDIFNQNNSFQQTTTEMFRQERTSNVLGRYGMLSFTYNLNTNQP